jgi:hypothetical protein
MYKGKGTKAFTPIVISNLISFEKGSGAVKRMGGSDNFNSIAFFCKLFGEI